VSFIISATVQSVQSSVSRNSGKTFWKVYVVDSKGVPTTLFVWDYNLVNRIEVGKSYDFTADFSDPAKKFVAASNIQPIVLTNEDMVPVGSQKAIEPPPPARTEGQEPSFVSEGSRPDPRELHIIRESCLGSAAQFCGATNENSPEEHKMTHDDVILIASKFEDYVFNGYGLD